MTGKLDHSSGRTFCNIHIKIFATSICIECDASICDDCKEMIKDNDYCPTCAKKKKNKNRLFTVIGDAIGNILSHFS